MDNFKIRNRGHGNYAIVDAEGNNVALVMQKEYASLLASAPKLLAEATELLRSAKYEDGLATVLTQDCEELEKAIEVTKETP